MRRELKRKYHLVLNCNVIGPECYSESKNFPDSTEQASDDVDLKSHQAAIS